MAVDTHSYKLVRARKEHLCSIYESHDSRVIKPGQMYYRCTAPPWMLPTEDDVARSLVEDGVTDPLLIASIIAQQVTIEKMCLPCANKYGHPNDE